MENFNFYSFDSQKLVGYAWLVPNPKAIVQIVHGMSEHSMRYAHFAKWLNQKQISVYAHDHRGHGKTAKSIENVGFIAQRKGWNKLVRDVHSLNQIVKSNHSGLKVIILGHSMGSFIVRDYINSFPEDVNATILSATGGKIGWFGLVGLCIAKLNALILGKKNRSQILDKLTFGKNNKRIKKLKSEKDWLTRDHEKVQEYLNDPFCCQHFTAQFYVDLATGVIRVSSSNSVKNIPKDMPLLIFAGTMDPIANYGHSVSEVANMYRSSGIKHVSERIFQDGRHEMLNEINKLEVYKMIFDWMLKTESVTP